MTRDLTTARILLTATLTTYLASLYALFSPVRWPFIPGLYTACVLAWCTTCHYKRHRAYSSRPAPDEATLTEAERAAFKQIAAHFDQDSAA